jgi:hypothetical protein
MYQRRYCRAYAYECGCECEGGCGCECKYACECEGVSGSGGGGRPPVEAKLHRLHRMCVPVYNLCVYVSVCVTFLVGNPSIMCSYVKTSMLNKHTHTHTHTINSPTHRHTHSDTGAQTHTHRHTHNGTHLPGLPVHPKSVEVGEERAIQV